MLMILKPPIEKEEWPQFISLVILSAFWGHITVAVTYCHKAASKTGVIPPLTGLPSPSLITLMMHNYPMPLQLMPTQLSPMGAEKIPQGSSGNSLNSGGGGVHT